MRSEKEIWEYIQSRIKDLKDELLEENSPPRWTDHDLYENLIDEFEMIPLNNKSEEKVTEGEK